MQQSSPSEKSALFEAKEQLHTMYIKFACYVIPPVTGSTHYRTIGRVSIQSQSMINGGSAFDLLMERPTMWRSATIIESLVKL